MEDFGFKPPAAKIMQQQTTLKQMKIRAYYCSRTLWKQTKAHIEFTGKSTDYGLYSYDIFSFTFHAKTCKFYNLALIKIDNRNLPVKFKAEEKN